jgi:mannose-1-phosphate guanylyltransferase/mannose-6-phosphate isomerase
LAGGSGTRFWPLSRRARPKQLLALEGGRTLLQSTVDRLSPLIEPHEVWIVTTRDLVKEVRRQLPDVPARQILVEPVGRNTAPAIAWSVRSMPEDLRQATVVVLPADHRVGDPDVFRLRLAQAMRAVEEQDLVLTLGVVPRWPETGYGYLRLGRMLDDHTGLRRVSRFTEKPDARTAKRFVKSGNYLWNAGIFAFRGARLLELVAEHVPQLHAGLEQIAAARDKQSLAELYPRLPAAPIDTAVMEKLTSTGGLRRSPIATLPLDCGWSDLGSWAALAEVRHKDDQGNAVAGDVVAVDAVDNLLYADRGTVAVLGVSNLVVVRTADSVLVMPIERAQEVRRVLAELESRGRTELV